MGSKTFRPTAPFNGVAAGSTATLNLAKGLTYHNLVIAYGGATLAQLNEIRVKANGRTIMVFTELDDLDSINQFNGRAAASGLITLDFERYGLDKIESRELTAIGTGLPRSKNNPFPIETLQVEVDIDGAAVAPTLSCKALQSAPRITGLLHHMRKFNFSPAGSGVFEIADLPRGLLINQLLIKSAGDYVTRLVIERDNFTIFDRTVAENTAIQIDGKRVPQSGWTVFDPSENGDGSAAMVTKGVNDLRFKVTTSAADTLTVYADYIGGFSG